MKKFLLTLAFALLIFRADSNAQWINSITIEPAQPTSNDFIHIYVDEFFPSADCEPYLVSLSVIGNNIYGSALHCIGMMAVICPYVDTFVIAPLPQGSYTFYMQLDAGGGPAPCTPGIAPGPNDSLQFVVDAPASIPTLPGKIPFTIVADMNSLLLQYPGYNAAEKNIFRLFSADGKRVMESQIVSASTRLVTKLSPGIYFASLQCGDAQYQKKFIQVK